MRYTEIRLARIAEEMLRDIEKETMDFGPNYDGSDREPLVLPTALPNLLVNGSSGIAVGMATNIPPHNLGEVVEALKLLVENPDASLDELLGVLPGPDFPTAGFIYGTEGIRQAYATGRGRIVMRGKAVIEELPGRKDRQAIVVTELPYQVNKAQLIEEIAVLVRDKRIEGIADIRDESDRDGIRMVLELKKDETPGVVLNQLYKFTKLQSTFGVISLAIVHGRPQVLPLKDLLRHFVDFRREVVVRRTSFDLRKAEERAHILEGLKVALDHLDEVIELIRRSRSPAEAKQALQVRFQFSEAQAQAILDMKLQRLTGLERQKIVGELEETLKLIERLRGILASDRLQLQIVVEELEKLKSSYGDGRRTVILPKAEEISVEDLIQEEEVVITVTHTGYIKRTALSTYRSQRRGGKGRRGMTPREEDAVQHLFVASTHDYILVFTRSGRMFWLKVHEIPDVSSAGRGKAVVNLIQIGPDDRVADMVAVREFSEGSYVVLATRNGYVKKTALSAFSHPRVTGILAIEVEPGDGVLAAGLSDGRAEIFMATSRGKAIRFREADVRPMGRAARGVIGMRLADGDQLVDMAVLSGKPDILTVSQNGYGKRTPVSEYRLQRRGGSGIINMRTGTRNGLVVTATEVGDEDQLLMITGQGKLIRMDVCGISRIGRATQGVRLIQLEPGDRVVAAICTEEREEEGKVAPVATAPDEDEEPLTAEEERALAEEEASEAAEGPGQE